MQDRDIDFYGEEGLSLRGYIRDDCLSLISEVYGKGYSSEKNYKFSKEDTEKLFSIISLDDFISSCREGHTLWMEEFLRKNDINPATFTF